MPRLQMTRMQNNKFKIIRVKLNLFYTREIQLHKTSTFYFLIISLCVCKADSMFYETLQHINQKICSTKLYNIYEG